jgi:glucosamine--fructose-6-phosphate aminotransferase (isomerizing)
MCGIIGVVGRESAVPRLLDGLRRLEYRGYDSAGLAVVNQRIDRCRAVGKLANLEQKLANSPLAGTVGIGHTRWATHGRPNEANAHPIIVGRVAVVHNGIIENHRTVADELRERGYAQTSETDTECIAGLISLAVEDGVDPETALVSTLGRLEGAFAFVVLIAGYGDRVFCAKRQSPLAIGYGEDAMYVGSDAIALAPLAPRISYLDDDDWAVLTTASVQVVARGSYGAIRPICSVCPEDRSPGKAGYRHYMEKEIYEQPDVIEKTLAQFREPATGSVSLPRFPFDLASISRVTMVACGSSYYAAAVARYWLEDIADIPTEIEVASEFRYRRSSSAPGGLAIFISQSGETADTLACLRHLRSKGQRTTLAIVNSAESSLAREADATIVIPAGPEIGVAATKTFTAQLCALFCLVIGLARARGVTDVDQATALLGALSSVPQKMRKLLTNLEPICRGAARLDQARDVLYLGRGTSYPLALEGALKLKEISYIHAEGFAAGEMKHGPIALIDETVSVVVIAPSGEFFEKIASNSEEVLARGGRVVLLSDAVGCAALARSAGREVISIEVPDCEPTVAPLLYALPIQLLAYHTALLRGTDLDQPRNLAKSVTVE